LRHLVCLSLVLVVLTLCGCKYGPLPSEEATKEAEKASTQPAGLDAEQKKLLEDILKYQQETGSTVATLAKEIERRKAMEAEAIGASPLQKDLQVARALLIGARRAVQSEMPDDAKGKLNRLRSAIGVMQAEAPAAIIRISLERASLALQGSSAGVEADVASACILSALDVALRSPDAPLVPDVAKPLEKAKQQVDQGDYKAALKAVEELIGTVSGHISLRKLAQAESGARGAYDAILREAWPVTLAELDNLSDVLGRVGTLLKAAPQTAQVEAEDTESAGNETASGETTPPEAESKTGEAAPANGAAPSPAPTGSATPEGGSAAPSGGAARETQSQAPSASSQPEPTQRPADRAAGKT